MMLITAHVNGGRGGGGLQYERPEIHVGSLRGTYKSRILPP